MPVQTDRLPAEPYAKIRLLLLQAHHSLTTDPVGAERCIAGAVRLLPEAKPQAPAAERPTLVLPKGGLAQWQVLRVKALIESRLAERLSSGDLAAAVRLSTSHFSKAFRCSFGDTPKLYINRRRIARSKVLMLESGESLAMVALACGLADQAHLCRLFRRFEGVSPSVWRRLNSGARHDLDRYVAEWAAR